MRRRELVLPRVTLDRGSSESLREQIARQIVEAIQTGSLGNGVRLPSTRMMAALLGVSRNTVVTAYEELLSADWIVGEERSGMRINAGNLRRGMHGLGVPGLIRAAHFPVKTLSMLDPDGNPLYLSF